METPIGEQVGDTTIDAGAGASDETVQNDLANVWEPILERTDVNSNSQAIADELEASLTDEDDDIPSEEEKAGDPDDPEAKQEKKPRSSKFKELQEEKTALETSLAERETENQTLKERQAALDVALEAHGGAEQVGALIDNQAKFIDPARYKEAVDYLETLPQAPAVYAEMLNRSFNIGDIELDDTAQARALANRVEVVNGALKKDFGLTADLSADDMAKMFQWIAVRANKDVSELREDLSDELDLLAPDEESDRDKETRKQIEDLRAQLEQQKAEKNGEKQEAEIDPSTIGKMLDDFEAEIFGEVGAEVLKEYNTTIDKLPPLKAKAFQALVRQELGASPVFVQLADYIISNSDHANRKYLQTQYRNCVKTLYRSIAVEFLGKPTGAAPAANTHSQTNNLTNTGITGQGISSIDTPHSKGKENPWGDILNRK